MQMIILHAQSLQVLGPIRIYDSDVTKEILKYNCWIEKADVIVWCGGKMMQGMSSHAASFTSQRADVAVV